MLVVHHDGTGDGEVAELCCLCRTPTRYWWGTGPLNVALCQKCAKTAKKRDLPTKAEWVEKERKLAKLERIAHV